MRIPVYSRRLRKVSFVSHIRIEGEHLWLLKPGEVALN